MSQYNLKFQFEVIGTKRNEKQREEKKTLNSVKFKKCECDYEINQHYII